MKSISKHEPGNVPLCRDVFDHSYDGTGTTESLPDGSVTYPPHRCRPATEIIEPNALRSRRGSYACDNATSAQTAVFRPNRSRPSNLPHNHFNICPGAEKRA